MKSKFCYQCDCQLEKDWIALNKKRLGKEKKTYLCLVCLADMLDCEVDDLEIKIEEFKDAGCTLFS